tara:strand:+ start:1655 stop:1903 length:249 start_codon:yes stop_codon:yes gene_type:complete
MIRSIIKEKGISLKEISDNTGLTESTVINTIYSERKKHYKTILNFVRGKEVIKGVENIQGNKRFQTLLMNGFSYWEAFRICE